MLFLLLVLFPVTWSIQNHWNIFVCIRLGIKLNVSTFCLCFPMAYIVHCKKKKVSEDMRLKGLHWLCWNKFSSELKQTCYLEKLFSVIPVLKNVSFSQSQNDILRIIIHRTVMHYAILIFICDLHYHYIIEKDK